MEELVRLLPTRAPSLEVFALTAVGITTDVFRALEEVLQEPSVLVHLRHLTFGMGDVITSHGAGYLCGGLMRDTRVHELFLDEAMIDYFAVGQIGQLLRQTVTVEVLSLRGVELSPCARKLVTGGMANTRCALQVLL
jgi:hypothetical protein